MKKERVVGKRRKKELRRAERPFLMGWKESPGSKNPSQTGAALNTNHLRGQRKD